MDKIRLEFEVKITSEYTQWQLEPICIINDKEFMGDFCFDIWDITKTFENCEYALFLCGCGDEGCAGIFETPKITANDKTISWHIFEPKECKFTFDKTQYISEVKRLQENMLKLYSLKQWEKIPYFFTNNVAQMPFLKYNF